MIHDEYITAINLVIDFQLRRKVCSSLQDVPRVYYTMKMLFHKFVPVDEGGTKHWKLLNKPILVWVSFFYFQ